MPALTPDTLNTLVPSLTDFPLFVETGTYHGSTIFAMEQFFDELHTIEIGDDLWRNTSNRYFGTKISFHLGDSSSVLAGLLPSLTQAAVFFLDGHWSCGDTARGTEDVPLLKELETICAGFSPAALIIIDDLRLFGQGSHSDEPVDWTSITIDAIRAIVGSRLEELREVHVADKLLLSLVPRNAVV